VTWEDGAPYLEEVAAGIYAYVQPAGGWMVNNCGVVTDAARDAVLVDTTSTERRNRALLAEIAGTGAREVRIAVNTHHHPDHTYGNGFLPESTTIVGHHLCREGVLRAGLAATAELPADYGELTVRAPDLTFSDRLSLHLDGFSVELITMGPAHSTNDVAVWLPEQRVLFAGDLAFSGGHPIFLEGSMLGFRSALQRMRELEPEVLVAGHGPVCRGDEVARVLDDLEAYVDHIARLADESYAAGLTPLEAAIASARSGDDPYAAWPEGERVVGNLHRAYVELTDYEAPFRLSIPNLWPEMVALHGGPIVSHA
jgi:cyclase